MVAIRDSTVVDMVSFTGVTWLVKKVHSYRYRRRRYAEDIERGKTTLVQSQLAIMVSNSVEDFHQGRCGPLQLEHAFCLLSSLKYLITSSIVLFSSTHMR